MWTLISSFFFSFSLSSSLNLSNSLYSFFFAPTERWGGSGGGWPAGAAAPPRRNPNNLFFWFFFLLPSSLPFLVSFLTSEFQDKLPTVLDLRDSIVKKGYYLWFGFWFGLRLARSRLPFFLLSNSVLDAVLRVDGCRDWIVCWWFCWLKIRCWLCVFWLQVWWWLLDSPEFGDVALMGFDGHGGEPLVLRTVESVLLSGFPCAPCCVAYVRSAVLMLCCDSVSSIVPVFCCISCVFSWLFCRLYL